MQRAINLTIYFFITAAIILKAPTYLDNASSEGKTLDFYRIDKFVSSKEKLPIVFPSAGKKSVVIFWATWCVPCKIELKRINSALESNEINPSSIFAISMDEDLDILEKTLTEKKYKFNTYLDKELSLTRKLKINATPTIVFIDENGKVKWQSTGVSFDPVMKIVNFLKS